jgi:hypothetical protein
MIDSRTSSPDPLLGWILRVLTHAAQRSTRQQRVADRLVHLTLALLLTLGRHTLTRVLVTAGLGHLDWSAAYRLFSRQRVDLEVLRRLLVWRLTRRWPHRRPLVVVLDGTQLGRTSRKLVGVGWLKAPRTPPWRSGIHPAQRWVGLSALLPISPQGDSRTVPLWFAPAPTPTAQPWPDHPPRREWVAGRQALQWLRDTLDELGQRRRPILAVADGSYGGAELWRSLPRQVSLLVRCPKNRALFHLPTAQPGRGRKRKYGARGPTPQAHLHHRRWTSISVPVRGRTIPLRVRVTGPWLVKPAPQQPLFLLVVRGIERPHRGRRIQRDPTFWLVSAVPDHHAAWRLPYPVATLLSVAWQRWEVEIMHRELKSGFGLGQQQAWSPTSACATIQWVVWSYAVLILAGQAVWGWSRSPTRTAWYQGRRWSSRAVVTALRQACWLSAAEAFWATLPGIGTDPGEMDRPPPRIRDGIQAAPHL